MQYESKVIEQFAERLYGRAKSIIIRYTVFGVLIGAGVGYAAMHRPVGTGIGAVIAGILGYSLGVEKAFLLKLQAQTALCQVQIERNTAGAG